MSQIEKQRLPNRMGLRIWAFHLRCVSTQGSISLYLIGEREDSEANYKARESEGAISEADDLGKLGNTIKDYLS